MNNDIKKQKKQQQQDRLDLLRICEKGNISLHFISSSHFKLIKNDYEIDIFPERKRYHDFMENKRAKYSNLVRFVKQKFNL